MILPMSYLDHFSDKNNNDFVLDLSKKKKDYLKSLVNFLNN